MRPQLQIALDTLTMEDALAPLQKAHSQIDIIECGTILIINEGLRAVREIRALFPEKPILADVRIAELLRGGGVVGVLRGGCIADHY